MKFETIAKIAKEKYGVNITRKEPGADSTFEAVFGISVDDILEPELPYEDKHNKSQSKRPPLPEPNLFKDGVGMYDFHGE